MTEKDDAMPLSTQPQLVERVVRTLSEMLQDRGCSKVERANVVDASCWRRLVADCVPVLKGTLPEGRTTQAFLHDEERVGIKHARTMLERAGSDADVVVVSRGGATPFTKKACASVPIQFFTVAETRDNVTRHVLVPRHTAVPEDDEALRGLQLKQLPRILTTDPVSRYYAWKGGQVIRVDRCFFGNDTVPFFRMVSPG